MNYQSRFWFQGAAEKILSRSEPFFRTILKRGLNGNPADATMRYVQWRKMK
jgi:hypothetical protein